MARFQYYALAVVGMLALSSVNVQSQHVSGARNLQKTDLVDLPAVGPMVDHVVNGGIFKDSDSSESDLPIPDIKAIVDHVLDSDLPTKAGLSSTIDSDIPAGDGVNDLVDSDMPTDEGITGLINGFIDSDMPTKAGISGLIDSDIPGGEHIQSLVDSDMPTKKGITRVVHNHIDSDLPTDEGITGLIDGVIDSDMPSKEGLNNYIDKAEPDFTDSDIPFVGDGQTIGSSSVAEDGDNNTEFSALFTVVAVVGLIAVVVALVTSLSRNKAARIAVTEQKTKLLPGKNTVMLQTDAYGSTVDPANAL